MSKRNLFLGTAAGKVGDVVVYRAGGTQRARVRVVPKDPKTSTQMIQRSRIGGVVATYRAAKGLLQDTFESKPSKQSAYNAFAQEAMPQAPYLLKTVVDAGCALPMPMQLSRGSLPNPFFNQVMTGEGYQAEVQVAANATGTTIGNLSKALVEARPCCFKNGSQILGVAIRYQQDEIHGTGFKTPILAVEKLVLDTESPDPVPSDGMMTFDVSEGLCQITLLDDASTPTVYGIIVVNEDAEGIHVTTCSGAMNEAATTAYTAARTAAAKQAVAESYGASGGSCVI